MKVVIKQSSSPTVSVLSGAEKNNVKVSATVAGGTPGPKGTDGKDGVDGASGRDGIDGAPGRDGVDGLPGANGRDGVDGLPGVNGRDGTDGTNGVDGAPGATGADGVPGQDGVDGLPGKDGLDGIPGLPGNDGNDGAQGPAGPKGEQGEVGAQGEPGGVGEQGPLGDKGPAGERGVDGNTGAVGDRGPQGLQGPVGNKGATGDAGVSGVYVPLAQKGVPNGVATLNASGNAVERAKAAEGTVGIAIRDSSGTTFGKLAIMSGSTAAASGKYVLLTLGIWPSEVDYRVRLTGISRAANARGFVDITIYRTVVAGAVIRGYINNGAIPVVVTEGVNSTGYFALAVAGKTPITDWGVSTFEVMEVSVNGSGAGNDRAQDSYVNQVAMSMVADLSSLTSQQTVAIHAAITS